MPWQDEGAESTVARIDQKAFSGLARRPRRRTTGAALLLLAPYLTLLLVFGIGPVVYAVYTAFTRVDLLTSEQSFSASANWSEVATDPRLGEATANVGRYLALWLPSLLLLVVTIALLAQHRRGRFSAAVRFACYVPGAISGSAAALVWLFMVTPEYSPFGPGLRALGFDSSSETITSGSLPVVLSVIATAVTAGGWIVVLYAALNALPAELMEAAAIDGASPLQTALQIKLPLIKNYLALMLISSFAYGTQLFVEPQVMRAAFTGQISETWSVNQLAYFFATQEGDFGKAAALSLLLMLVGVLLAVAVMRRTDFYATDATKDRR